MCCVFNKRFNSASAPAAWRAGMQKNFNILVLAQQPVHVVASLRDAKPGLGETGPRENRYAFRYGLTGWGCRLFHPVSLRSRLR